MFTLITYTNIPTNDEGGRVSGRTKRESTPGMTWDHAYRLATRGGFDRAVVIDEAWDTVALEVKN